MRKSNDRLSSKQTSVIDDLFDNQLSETELIEKYRIGRNVFKKWMRDEKFIDELEFKMESARRQSRMIIARYGPLAAAKLVELTESDKPETARKACLDIIDTACKESDKKASGAKADKADAESKESAGGSVDISEKLAGKLLAVLAEGV